MTEKKQNGQLTGHDEDKAKCRELRKKIDALHEKISSWEGRLLRAERRMKATFRRWTSTLEKYRRMAKNVGNLEQELKALKNTMS